MAWSAALIPLAVRAASGATALVLSLSLVGCAAGTGNPVGTPGAASTSQGGPSAAVADHAGSVDVCALVSTSDASDALGDDVVASPMPSSGWVAGQCVWSTVEGEVLFSVSVGTEASLRDAGDSMGSDASTRFDAFRAQAAARGGGESLEEIGDGAVVTPTGLAAHVGEVYVEAVNLGVPPEDLAEVVRKMTAGL